MPLRVRRALPPDARLLLWVLAVFAAGTGCCAASMILAVTWAATGTPGLLTAAHWLTRGAYALLAVIVVLGVVLGQRKRRQARKQEGQGS